MEQAYFGHELILNSGKRGEEQNPRDHSSEAHLLAEVISSRSWGLCLFGFIPRADKVQHARERQFSWLGGDVQLQ